MTDWTDEARARLEEDIANLPSISEHAADIRAMLEENKRLQRDLTAVIGAAQRFQPAGSPPPVSNDLLVLWICRSLSERAEAAEAKLAEVQEEARLNRAAAEKHYAYGEAQKERAEAAEAKLAEADRAALQMSDRCIQQHAADRAEVERLGMELRELRDILGGSDPEREDGECARCGEPYSVRPGCDYSPECDSCAQEILGNARAALRGGGK